MTQILFSVELKIKHFIIGKRKKILTFEKSNLNLNRITYDLFREFFHEKSKRFLELSGPCGDKCCLDEQDVVNVE